MIWWPASEAATSTPLSATTRGAHSINRLRIAAVTVVGLVTVTTLIGNGGYGAFIDDGLNRRFSTPIVLGATLSVVLAGVIDVALYGLERLATPWRRAGRGRRRG